MLVIAPNRLTPVNLTDTKKLTCVQLLEVQKEPTKNNKTECDETDVEDS